VAGLHFRGEGERPGERGRREERRGGERRRGEEGRDQVTAGALSHSLSGMCGDVLQGKRGGPGERRREPVTAGTLSQPLRNECAEMSFGMEGLISVQRCALEWKRPHLAEDPMPTNYRHWPCSATLISYLTPSFAQHLH